MKYKRKKKYQSGLIIRLIDVVMILLFGFIAISEVNKKSMIKLAKSVAVPSTYPDRETVVFIGILPDGRFLVKDETSIITNIATLRRYIQSEKNRLNRQKIRMRVRIRSNYNTPVKYSFSVVRICQDLKIPVGLDVIKVSN